MIELYAEVDGDVADASIALWTGELPQGGSAGTTVVPFHEAFRDAGALPTAARVRIDVPVWRGYGFLRYLSSMVRGFSVPGDTRVQWSVERRAAEGTKRTLAAVGWVLCVQPGSAKSVLLLEGPVPTEAPPVEEPRSFSARLGKREFTFLADWGVFAQDRIDSGTELLRVRMEDLLSPGDSLLDVGTGYGPLAVWAASERELGEVGATDIDSVAIALANANARRYDRPIRFDLTGDCRTLPATSLTVCNFPTHAERENADKILRHLIERSEHGLVAVVVHRSLEQRFSARLETAGMDLARLPSATHVVLTFGAA